MAIPELSHFPLNPSYGQGIYRRRLVFTAVRGGMVAQVDDTLHSFWLILDHDQERVTGIDAGFLRAPTNMCTGSIAGLKALVGRSLHEDSRDYLAGLPNALNCTHLSDLAVWTIAQAGRSATWTIEVPDQSGAPVWIAIERNGEPVHRWQIAGFQISAPQELADKPLMGGFMKWALAAYADEALLGAIMLQRGLFVARGRQHIVDQGDAVPLAEWVGMAGMCWSYSGKQRLEGMGSLGFARDFTQGVRPETSPHQVQERLRDAV